MVPWKLSNPRRCFANSVNLNPPVMTTLLHAKLRDGRPALNSMDLRRLSISSIRSKDEQNIRYILQNGKFLEKLHLSVDPLCSLVGLLSPSARTLKILGLTVLYLSSVCSGVCEELEAMAGHDILEALSFEVKVVSQKTGFCWIRIPRSGGFAGQTWVVRLEPVFF